MRKAMKYSPQPIRTIEDAFRFLAKREGSISFRASSTFPAIVGRVKVTGEDEMLYRNDRAYSNSEIDNVRYDLFTHTIIQLAEEIRATDAASSVEFTWPQADSNASV